MYLRLTRTGRDFSFLVLQYVILALKQSLCEDTVVIFNPSQCYYKPSYPVAMYTLKQCPVDGGSEHEEETMDRSEYLHKNGNVEIVYSRIEGNNKKRKYETEDVLKRYMQSLLLVADEAVPIERYLYKMLEYYKERAEVNLKTLNIVGSTGNKLYVPERQPDGSYNFEVDVLFENPVAGMSIPVIGDQSAVVAWFSVDRLDNSLPLGSVGLRLNRFDGKFGSESEESQWFHKHAESGKILLSSMKYWGSVTSNHRSILGERELLVHPSPLLQPLFKTFKSEKKALLLNGQTYEFTILMDKVAAVRIPWPEEAAPFETRTRKWPESGIIDKVIGEGCHLVYNPHNRGGTYFLEWKYTFSTSEQEIVLNFSPFQRSLFLIIKQMKRLYLDYGTSEIGEPLAGLTTYHLKTIMLWLSERLDPKLWETSPLDCLVLFFRDLEKCLDTAICPHYFIPEINVMQSAWKPKMLQQHEHDWLEQNGSMREKLLKTVRSIIANPNVYLTDALLTAVDSKHIAEATKEPVRNKDDDKTYVELDILDQAIVRMNDRQAMNELNLM